MSSKKSKNKTVSEKIAESFLPRALRDPENDPENLVKIADFDEDEELFALDNRPSEIRKRNVKLLSDFSDKYKGKITSRKELENNDESENDTEEAESDEDVSMDDVEGDSSEEEQSENDDQKDSKLEAYKKQLNRQQKGKPKAKEVDEGSSDQTDSDENAEDSSGDSDDDEEDEGTESGDSENAEISDNEPMKNEDARILSESNQNDEIQKGLAVQNQLKLWEKLLEIRIHSQKMLTKANSLPAADRINELRNESEEFRNSTSSTTKAVATLLQNMLEMQSTLASQYSEMKALFKSGRKRAIIESSTEPAAKRFAPTLDADFESFNSYRNSVLQKWDDRTKILAPGTTGKKGNRSSSTAADHFDIMQKIDAVLMNKSDLLAKSRTVKGNYQLFGANVVEPEENTIENGNTVDRQQMEQIASSPEIYDDTDFYHQQLRELIEYKSNTISNPAEMNRQFAELQKLRQKMKKKVDTRASKGRKIRYVVHNKLMNFMAPNSHSEWTEESKTELYRSLFAT